MNIPALQTFEQFEQYEDDGMRHDLLKGEHIVQPPLNIRQSRIQHDLYHLLRPWVHQQRLGDMLILAGFKLSSDTFLQPDVSFLRTAQLLAADPDGYLEGSPALAIQIVTDSNMGARLDLKTEQYFAHGSEEVWIVYPKTRNVQLNYPDGTSKTFAKGELRSDLFPGWSTPVASLFPNS
jgi:Uma2 family endonuclease